LATWKTEKLTDTLSFGNYFTASVTLHKAQAFQTVIQIRNANKAVTSERFLLHPQI